MKHAITSRFLFLRFLAALPGFSLLIFMTSCSKNMGLGGANNSYNIIDKNFFFTVNINGKAYTSYGWYSSDHSPDGTPYTRDRPSIHSYNDNDIDPISGDTIRKYYITVVDYAFNNLPPRKTGDCNATIGITRKGSQLGPYTLMNNLLINFHFNDLDGKSYSIEEPEQFIITRISPIGTAKSYVEGTFTCNLSETPGSTTTPIPATGSFRLEGF